jgi:hypothetical protein
MKSLALIKSGEMNETKQMKALEKTGSEKMDDFIPK